MTARGVRAVLVNLATSAGALAVFLGLAEGLARWAEPAPLPASELIRGWQEWEDEFYRFGVSPPHWPPDGNINRDGLRDAHHSLESPEGTERLLVLGDSVTYGYGAESRNAFPQVLQRRLEQGGERLEVFNVAAPGWTTRQERLAYERLMRPYGARHALLAVCLNDPLELYQNLSRPPAWLAQLHRHSALLRRLVAAREREVRDVEDMQRAPDSPVARQALAHFFGEVKRLRGELGKDGVTLGLVVPPYRFQVLAGAPPPAVQARLAAFARDEQLPFQDLLPVLQPLGERAFIDYCHLSLAGTARVAEALLDGPLLPARVSYASLLQARGLARGSPAALLVTLLRAPRADERAAAAWALQRPALDDVALRAVTQCLRDPSEAVRLESMRALARVRASEAARPLLMAALASEHEAERLEAARVLWAWAPDAAGAPQLVAALAHSDAYVRAFAEESLARLGPAAVAELTRALERADSTVRRRAARLLGRTGRAAASAGPRLAQLLVDEDAGVRRQAARALGQIAPHPPDVVPALRRAAQQDQDAQVRAAADQALKALQAGAS